MAHTHRVKPGDKVHLKDLPTRGRDFRDDRANVDKEFKALRREFIELQRRLYSEGRRKLLVVLQAMDAGGKDGTIRNVTRGVNPQGVRVASFKVPTPFELAHDFLWRIHVQVPSSGMISIFNRSYFEDVVVTRVDGLVPEEVWRSRYDRINEFERLLMDGGTTILKFFLHISKDEQKQRLEARIQQVEKHWKFSIEDLTKRKQWDDYMTAYSDAIRNCSTEAAPWFVIPADQKWYRNYAVAKVIVHTLRQMDPQYPPAIANVEDIKID